MEISIIGQKLISPYMSKGDICKSMKMSKTSLDRRLKEIRNEVKQGRYSEYAIIKDGGIVWVNYLVLIDYMKNRQMLLDSNAKKYVEPFNGRKVVEQVWGGTDKGCW